MKRNLTHAQLSALTGELSMLVHAGVPVAESLSLMARESDGLLKQLLSAMEKRSSAGLPLSKVMEETSAFPSYVCGLVEVGERSGRLEEALSALSADCQRRAELDRWTGRAFVYPAAMLVLMTAVIGVLLVRVLPVFNEVYASFGGSLTGVAGALLTLGRWLGKALPVLWVLLAAVLLLFLLFTCVPPFRRWATGLWRRAQGDRGAGRQINNARVVSALSMAVAGGLDTEEALALAEGLVTDTPQAARRCRDCQVRIEGGSTLEEALLGSGILGPGDSRLLGIAQRTGSLDEALERLARRLTEEGEAAQAERAGRVEPTMVLICSLLVGAVLLTVMLPLIQVLTAVG